MNTLTIQKLKKLKPNAIFATGYTSIPHPWDSSQEIQVQWAAVRGTIHDWAIYHSFSSRLEPYQKENIPLIAIAEWGTKLHDIQKVQQLVPSDLEALQMYRH